MKHKINRRQAIAGTVAGLATVPLASAPLAAMTDNDPDAELIGLYWEYYESWEAYKAALRRVSDECDLAGLEYPKPDECILQADLSENGTRVLYTHPYVMYPHDIYEAWEKDCKSSPDTCEQLRAKRQAAFDEWSQKRDVIDARYDIEGLEDKATDACHLAFDIPKKISKVPAMGLTGIAIKLNVWCGGDYKDDGDIGHFDGLPYSATRDVLRITGLPEITG